MFSVVQKEFSWLNHGPNAENNELFLKFIHFVHEQCQKVVKNAKLDDFTNDPISGCIR